MEQKLLKKLKKHQNAKVFVSMDSNNTQVVHLNNNLYAQVNGKIKNGKKIN